MWFGDLVTMRWWDDLWLNESFAEWAAHHASVKATKYTDAWTGFTNARKNWAYRQDQLPSTHPVAADNHDLEAVEVNFDGITYAKGASILKQLVAWVGEDEFLSGLRDYFAKHAFGNTEFGDLLDRPGGRLRARPRPPGPRSGCRPPASTRCARLRGRRGRRLHLASRSSRPTTPTSRRCAATASASASTTTEGGRLVRRHHVETDVDGASTDDRRARRPAAARPAAAQRRRPVLRQDPARRAVAGDAWSRRIDTLDDSLARALCWGAAWDMTRDAELSATDFATLVLRGVGTETDLTAVSALLRYAKTAVDTYSAPENRAAAPGPLGARACAGWRWPPSRAATTSWRSCAPSPPPPAATRRSTASPGWYDGSAAARRASPSTPTCAGCCSTPRSARAGPATDEIDGRAAARQHDLGPRAGRRGAGAASRPRRPRRRPGRPPSSATTPPTRPSARSRCTSRCPATRRCSRRTSSATSRPPRRSGRPRASSGSRVVLQWMFPRAPRHPGRAGPGRGVAGRQPGQPRGGALRARGRRRPTTCPGRPGVRRRRRLTRRRRPETALRYARNGTRYARPRDRPVPT